MVAEVVVRVALATTAMAKAETERVAKVVLEVMAGMAVRATRLS